MNVYNKPETKPAITQERYQDSLNVRDSRWR